MAASALKFAMVVMLADKVKWCRYCSGVACDCQLRRSYGGTMRMRFVWSVAIAIVMALLMPSDHRVRAASGCSISIYEPGFPELSRIRVDASWTDISPDDWIQIWVDWGDGTSSSDRSSASSGTLYLSHGYASGDYTLWYQLAGNVAGECIPAGTYDVHK